VACHGYYHRLVYHQTPDEFRQDIRKAKKILEEAVGVPVIGYRAPSFSIVEKTKWALGILKEEGFLYDASIFPAPHARGGMAGADRFPSKIDGLAEFPMSTVRLMGKSFAFAGGGHLRLFPYKLIRWSIDKCNRGGYPSMVYIHPWELDPGQPRLKARRIDMFKHYVNINQTEMKLRALLRDFKFNTVRQTLEGIL